MVCFHQYIFIEKNITMDLKNNKFKKKLSLMWEVSVRRNNQGVDLWSNAEMKSGCVSNFRKKKYEKMYRTKRLLARDQRWIVFCSQQNLADW